MKNPKDKTVIIICGPTAVGKTAVAISIAKHFQTEIISADSRQCFKELNIGVARPSDEELKEVPHHFIASHSIKENIMLLFLNNMLYKKQKSFLKTMILLLWWAEQVFILKLFVKAWMKYRQ